MFKLIKKENGFTLVEVLVALSIMAIVALIFLLALLMAGKAVLLAQEKTIAESIARSQMEYVKQQGYQEENDHDDYYTYKTAEQVQEDLSLHPSFSVWSVTDWGNIENPIVYPLNDSYIEGVHGVDWDSIGNGPADNDSNIRKLGLVILHGEKVVYYLEGYKVDN